MITIEGYSNNPMDIPEGIAVTFGQDLIKNNGGIKAFLKHFQETMATDEIYWLHKCKNKPKYDVLYVYIIVCNRVAYRVYLAGYETGPSMVYDNDGIGKEISWPRLLLAGPLEKAPVKIVRKGFRGFRYTTKLF
jgi:hypothetical protein